MNRENLSPNEKRKQTVMQRYGVENVSRLSESKIKSKETNLIKYGVENVNQVEDFRIKARATNLERYGTEYPAHVEKFIETSMKRYGVRHPMQNIDVFDRSMKARFKIKTYITLSGSVLQYQGYEDVAIKFLLEDYGLDEKEILTSRSLIPKIFYDHPITKKNARYYPDIWVKSLNLLIEVKSKYTYAFQTDVTMEKQAACKAQGYHHIILICSKTKILEMI